MQTLWAPPSRTEVVLERPPLDVRAWQVIVTLGSNTEGAFSKQNHRAERCRLCANAYKFARRTNFCCAKLSRSLSKSRFVKLRSSYSPCEHQQERGQLGHYPYANTISCLDGGKPHYEVKPFWPFEKDLLFKLRNTHGQASANLTNTQFHARMARYLQQVAAAKQV